MTKLALFLLPIAAFAQRGFWSVTAGPGGHAVTGQPYSAEQTGERVQILADGTRIIQTSTARLYRDSEGRTRTEYTVQVPGANEPHVTIEIYDPVAQAHYFIDPAAKTVHKNPTVLHDRPAFYDRATTTTSSVPAIAPRTREHEPGNRPKTTTEKLGTETMEGLTVEGIRRTTTWPAGSSIGNDRPMTHVSEQWFSRELGITILSKETDPRFGETTERTFNITRTEPDPSLFQPPADYRVEEPGRPAPR